MYLDVGISGSSSATSSNALNSAFNVSGGGGSAAVSTAPDSPITGTGGGLGTWLPWAVVGAAVLGLFGFLLVRK